MTPPPDASSPMSDQPDPRDTPALSEEQIATLLGIIDASGLIGASLHGDVAAALRRLQWLEQAHRARVPVEACPTCADLTRYLATAQRQIDAVDAVLGLPDGYGTGRIEKLRALVPGADAQAVMDAHAAGFTSGWDFCTRCDCSACNAERDLARANYLASLPPVASETGEETQ